LKADGPFVSLGTLLNGGHSLTASGEAMNVSAQFTQVLATLVGSEINSFEFNSIGIQQNITIL